jgi:lipoprotein-releasing system ATP-binding protein
MKAIEASGLRKRYGQLEVLRGVDLTIASGEVVAVVGPSGAGKSTLLHILGTLDRPDAGTVQIGGQSITGMGKTDLDRLRNERIGFVFQAHHLLPEFTALENACMPGWIANKPKEQVRREAESLLETLGLSDRLEHKPAELSGGEQQRVAVARALVNQPQVVLADEPSGNLDAATSEELHRLFFVLREKRGCAFVIVTHNPELAAMADRTLTMKDGRMLGSSEASSTMDSLV